MTPLAAKAARWLEELGAITDEPPFLTRTFLSPALAQAKVRVAEWMRDSGLEVHEDQAGNVIGRRDCGHPAAGTVVCGSHLDTVRNGGKFDGALGVVAAILAAELLRNTPLPWHLEVVGFSDEEGVRFQTTYLGSRHFSGRLSEDTAQDAQGISVREAITAHHPAFPPPPPRGPLLGYVEAHIEQGPVLETTGLPLGVATAIAGQTRARVFLEGKSGHAGTTPMTLRRDALAGAAECTLLVEERATAANGLVATVGELRIASAASNVIPGQVDFTLDIRDADDDARKDFCQNLFSEMERRMTRRGLTLRIAVLQDSPSVRCDPRLTGGLAARVEARQSHCPHLVSGAGHDAVALAEVTKVALLFVRCRGGLSHHPDEFAHPEDIAAAVEVLADFLCHFPTP